MLAAALALAVGSGVGPDASAAETRTLSVNFAGYGNGRHGIYKVSAGDSAKMDIGLEGYAVPGGKWMDCETQKNGATSLADRVEGITLKDDTGNTGLYEDTGLYLCSKGDTWAPDASSPAAGNATMLYLYLDNAYSKEGPQKQHAGFKLTGLPFARYDAVVYFNTDMENAAIPAYEVNGAWYTGAAGGAAPAASSTNTWGAPFGKTAPEAGVNTLVVTGLTNSTLTVRPPDESAGRGCIAGFQVRGELPDRVYDYEPVVFTDPADWKGAMAFPMTAKRDAPTNEPAYAFDDAFTQTTTGGREMTVASVTNGAGDINLWGVHGEKYPSGGRVFDRDIFLDVRGGTFNIVSAGLAAYFTECTNALVKGRQLTQIAGTARVNDVFGAGGQGGTGTDIKKDGKNPELDGDAGVVVKDSAVVLGTVAGGWKTEHNGDAKVTGRAAVRIENVQGETSDGGAVIGGSVWGWNVNSRSEIGGDTSVTVDIAPVNVLGPTNFVKEIAGGSRSAPYLAENLKGDQTVEGNASVTISAPANVTFTAPIHAGGLDPSPAPGSNGTVIVKGTATLTLNGGTFACPLDAGVANGEKKAVLGGTNILASGASFTGFTRTEFLADGVTRVAGSVALDAGGAGAVSAGPGSALEVAPGGELAYDIALGTNLPAFTALSGTVTVTGCEMAFEDIRAGKTAAAGSVAPGTAAAENGAVGRAFRGEVGIAGCDPARSVRASFALDGEGVVRMGAAAGGAVSYTKKEGEADFAWDKTEGAFDDEGTFSDLADAAFLEGGLPGQAVGVNLPECVLAGGVVIESGYDLTNRAINAAALTKRGGGASSVRGDVLAGHVDVAEGSLDVGTVAAGTVSVSNGAALRAGMVDRRAVRFLRLTVGRVQTEGEAATVSELRLFRAAPGGGHEKIEWPAGTRLSYAGAWCVYRGREGGKPLFEGNFTPGNGAVNAMIDGFYEGCGFDSPYDGSDTNALYNKIWLTVGTPVTVEFPAAIPMPSGYNFCLADHGPRHPMDWKVDVSLDGVVWTAAHSHAGAVFDANPLWQGNPDSNKWLDSEAHSGGSADEPAFLFPRPGEGAGAAEVTVAAGGTIAARGDWTADLSLEGGASVDAREPGSRLNVLGKVEAAAGGGRVNVDVSGRALAPGEMLIAWEEGPGPERNCFRLIGARGCYGVENTPEGLKVIPRGFFFILN